MEFNIAQRATKKNLTAFAEEIKKISEQIGFKISARGWCYQLEVEGLITKAEFDKVENFINKCRKQGILPIDFTAEEEGRKFSGVEIPDTNTPIQHMKEWIEAAMINEEYYTPDWWVGEEYYIQMVVEKIDLKTLFEPVCKKYHIPIATSKGWSSMLQRAIYAKRFLEAEEKGLRSVLLYCGDHDPDGLRISDFIKKNIEDLENIVWEDGCRGYNPDGLEIIRFGIDHDFIEKHNLSWTDNLITGKKRLPNDLADPRHPNHKMPYVQEYIERFGARKCEANAIVPMPVIARQLVEETIIGYVGQDALIRFDKKTQEVKKEVDDFREKTGLQASLQQALDLIERGGEK